MRAILSNGEEITFKSFNEIVGKEFYDNITILYCDFNKLKELPELPKSLIELYCYNNQLEKLPELPKSLIELVCSYNKLKELPLSMLLCNRLNYCNYSNNEIVLTIPQMRFLERPNNRNTNNSVYNSVYNDTQNVHNHNIQLSLVKSINALMKD